MKRFRISEKETHLYSWIISVLLHLVILLVGIPMAFQRVPDQKDYRIPVTLQYTQEKVEDQKEPKPKTESEKLVSNKSQANAKQSETKPTRLPGDQDNPTVTNRIDPVYPKRALNEELEGRVMVEVTVGIDGKPKKIKILKSSGHDILDNTLIRTIRQYYTFKPKRVSGENQEDKLKLSYEYKL